MDIRKCDLNLLQETFLSLQANQEEIRARMAEKAAIYRRDSTSPIRSVIPSRREHMSLHDAALG